MLTDPTGEVIRVCDDGFYDWKEVDGEWGFYNSNNEKYAGDNQFVNQLSDALSRLMSGGVAGHTLVKYLSEHESVTQIFHSDRSVTDGNNNIGWNETGVTKDGKIEAVPTVDGPDMNPIITLGHELAHVEYELKNGNKDVWLSPSEYGISKTVTNSDIYTTHYENLLRIEHQLPLRSHYIINKWGIGVGPAIIDNNGRSLYFDTRNKMYFKPLQNSQLRYSY